MAIHCYITDNLAMALGYSQDNPFEKERKILGRSIKRLREKKGITQEQLAEKANINVSYLAKIENGYVNTTVRYLIKLGRGLSVSVKNLFEF
ncbi:MAG TPA: helix-turn-helix transcriptional regulator [Candidatus Saccharimonadales bacterium]|nr:helix-turn-helix transcriptional regulator [Candidatus Saccharimonadales bacterium]